MLSSDYPLLISLLEKMALLTPGFQTGLKTEGCFEEPSVESEQYWLLRLQIQVHNLHRFPYGSLQKNMDMNLDRPKTY
jgi:hypothetical protein